MMEQKIDECCCFRDDYKSCKPSDARFLFIRWFLNAECTSDSASAHLFDL